MNISEAVLKRSSIRAFLDRPIDNQIIGNNNIIGPFAFLRGKTKIKNNCIIAAYVEITRSLINNKTIISHRAFIGDANIGDC